MLRTIARAVLVLVVTIAAIILIDRRTADAAPPKPVQYLVVAVDSPGNVAAQQAVLDQAGKQGWQLVGYNFAGNKTFIFQR